MIDIRHVANMIAPDQIFETAGPSRAVQVSMKRQSTGLDFTLAALFIVSDAAGFINGVDLHVDGGLGVLTGNVAI